MMPRHPDGDVRLDAGYESGAQGEAQAREIIKVSPLKGKRLMGLGREEGRWKREEDQGLNPETPHCYKEQPEESEEYMARVVF